MRKQAVLVVSFGTSYNDSRKKTIEAVERSVGEAFPEYERRRAFTSGVIRSILKKRDNLEVDSVSQALDRLKEEGYESVLIQPTHVIRGEEYNSMRNEIEPFRSHFHKLACAAPLLAGPKDYESLARIMIEELKEYDEEGTEILLIGHGTDHEANDTYGTINGYFAAMGKSHIHVGTVEAHPSLDDMIEEVEETEASRVILQPLMIVAGDHAHNDMAGETNSWKTRFEEAGYEVVCRIKGLGEIPGVCAMFVDHAREAVQLLEGE